MTTYMSLYTYIYIYKCVCVYVCVGIYIMLRAILNKSWKQHLNSNSCTDTYHPS